MFFEPACIPCIMKQAYNSAKFFSKGNKDLELKIIQEVCAEALKLNGTSGAQRFSRTIQDVVEKYCGINDLYREIKDRNIVRIQRYLTFIETMTEAGTKAERLETALRAAIIGNIIDYGAKPDYNIEAEINTMTSGEIILSDFNKFAEDLNNSELILYIGDNYEETLFDKFLLKELLPKSIIFAVRSRPILNDITLPDSQKIGIDKICTVIESGSTIAGTDLSECTPEFLDIFRKADVVIAKGQGNYESLYSETRPIYFMFKVKCEVISDKCGFPVGSGVLIHKTK